MASLRDRVLNLAEELGVVSRSDIREAGLPEVYLAQLATAGRLMELAPGTYMHPDYEASEHVEFVIVARRVSHAVFFGITALQFHGLTTQVSHDLQIAIERGKWTPRLEWPSIEVFHISGEAFTTGIEEHTVEQTTVRVYSIAKTVADLFKFRNRIGLDVAIEALREGWRDGRFTMDELHECMKVCRVQTAMRPYVEMLE